MAYLKWNCVVIPDCAKYNEKQVREQLTDLREENPGNEKLKIRSDNSYVNEWAVHALCYDWGIMKEKTKDADMEFVLEFMYKLLYGITGPVSRLILKLFY